MILKNWLKTFRIQTTPETVLGVLVPYLAVATLWDWRLIIFIPFLMASHWISFGHNGIMDTAMGYDVHDPTKAHHPLITGELSLQSVHNVIHWSMAILTILGAGLTLWLSPNPVPALIALLIWYAFGNAYNDGLSKESIWGFLAISMCTAGMVAWGWFLSHTALTWLGIFYLAYMFLGMTYQISVSGFLVDMETQESSNFLKRLGAKLRYDLSDMEAQPILIMRKARVWGRGIKFINLLFGLAILSFVRDPIKIIWFVLVGIIMVALVIFQTEDREYFVGDHLVMASIVEILTIFLPIPLLLPWNLAILLMVSGVLWFYWTNRYLWGAAFPDV